MNLVVIKGNLTRDPEMRYTPKGTAVAELSVAINDVYYDSENVKHEETTFVGVTFWGRTAESVGKYFAKGKPIMVQGRLRQDVWEDKTTGSKRSKTFVNGEKWEFAGGNGESGGRGRAEAWNGREGMGDE